MMKRVFVGLLAASAGASAADHGFYVGVGRASVDAHYGPDRSVAFPADAGLPKGIAARDLRPLGASAWRAVAGYRVVDWLAIESGYDDFAGDDALTGITCVVAAPCPAREVGDADSLSLSVLAIYPRGPFDLFVKAGAARWRGDVEFRDSDGSHLATTRTNGTDPVFGAGVQLRYLRVLARLEYARAKFGEDSANLVSLELACTF
jgi:hypothetical protein